VRWKPWIGQIGNAFGGGVSGIDAEVSDWEARVIGLGSSVSVSTLNAANVMMRDFKANGLRSKILRFGIYAGNTKAACAAPFIKDIGGTTDVFTAALTSGTWVYNETGVNGGLQSTGSDVSNTGIFADNVSLPLEDYHIGVYKSTLGNRNIAMGAAITAVGTAYLIWDASGVYTAMFVAPGSNDIGPVTDVGQIGHYVATRNGTLRLFKNGASIAANLTPGGARPHGEILVHNASLDGAPWPAAATSSVLACYHVGLSLTAGEALTLYTIIQAFQTALTRNV